MLPVHLMELLNYQLSSLFQFGNTETGFLYGASADRLIVTKRLNQHCYSVHKSKIIPHALVVKYQFPIQPSPIRRVLHCFAWKSICHH